MTAKQKVFKYLGLAGNILFYLLLLVLLLFSISNIAVNSVSDIPNIFGKGFVSILSGSMDSDQPDSFPKGSLVFIDVLNEDQKDSIEVGQIVVFYDTTLKIHIIHRVVNITGEVITTQGDVNAKTYGTFDGTNFDPNMQLESNHKSVIIGRYTGSMAGVGDFIQEIRSSEGFLLWIVLPLLILFAFEVVVLVRSILAHNKAKLEARHALEKEALKQELLKELQQQKESSK